MKYIKVFEDINIFDQNDPDVEYRFKKGDQVKKIVPQQGWPPETNDANVIYIIDWLFLQNQRKYYGIQFSTGEDAGIESENNLRKLEDYELDAIKYNL